VICDQPAWMMQYLYELNLLAVELSTSTDFRDRMFLEERLKVAKQNLDDASSPLAQFRQIAKDLLPTLPSPPTNGAAEQR
jgi:hypothetical protein